MEGGGGGGRVEGVVCWVVLCWLFLFVWGMGREGGTAELSAAATVLLKDHSRNKQFKKGCRQYSFFKEAY